MMEPTRYIRANKQATDDAFDRAVHDARYPSSRYGQPQAPEKSGYPLEENLPIFLSASEEENHAAELQDNWSYDDRAQEEWPPESDFERNASQHNALQHDALQQSALQHRSLQPADWQHSGYEQDPWEQETWETRRRKGSIARTIVKFGFVTAAVAGAVFAAFNFQGRHALIADASASLAAVLPALSSTKASAPKPPTQAAVGLVQGTATAQPNPLPSPASAPSRQAIANAFQTALQTQPAIQAPPSVIQPPVAVQPPEIVPPPPAPAARSIDPEELAALLKRAQSMMDIGDIASARLFLERAAGARDAKAALLLAQTYDPAVLGATDLRTITADPATARLWYQKAAEFGSEEARSRLAQMNN
jgi:hypothetical protein